MNSVKDLALDVFEQKRRKKEESDLLALDAIAHTGLNRLRHLLSLGPDYGLYVQGATVEERRYSPGSNGTITVTVEIRSENPSDADLRLEARCSHDIGTSNTTWQFFCDDVQFATLEQLGKILARKGS